MNSHQFLFLAGIAACGHPAATAVAPMTPSNPAPAPAPIASATQLTAVPLALPGASGPVALDYLCYEPEKSRIWVPAGGTGSVAVLDISKREFIRVEGFKTVERELHGKKRQLGPSSASIGDGFAYVGNRASQEICTVDLRTLKTSACLELAAPPDGVQYVPSLQQVWVTTPTVHALTVLQALPNGQLKAHSIIPLEGEPEGYALDAPHGRFLTNLEDKGTTLSIDLKTQRVMETWSPGCSADGPRGVAVDAARGIALVACTDHVQALDLVHGGALLGKLETGAGLDNIDYVPSTRLVYAAAGKAARLTIAHLGDQGEFQVVASGQTATGARNAVADASGNAYVADGQNGGLLILAAPQGP